MNALLLWLDTRSPEFWLAVVVAVAVLWPAVEARLTGYTRTQYQRDLLRFWREKKCTR